MNRINPKEAPEGYVARKPKQKHKKYGFWLCQGCAFYSNNICLKDVRLTYCTCAMRQDNRTVIFVKKKT